MLNNKGHVLAFDDSPISENSPLDSIAYNKIIDSLKTSTLRCLNRSRDLTSNLSKLNKALSAENAFLMSKINDYSIPNVSTAKTALITGYDTVEPGYLSNAVQNKLSGQIIIQPLYTWSKVIRYMDKNGRNRASKDISISFGPSDGTVSMQPLDSDIYTILDGYNDSYWLADTVEGQQYTIMIQFPASIKPYVNYLSLIPFPAFGFKLDSVRLLKVDGSYETITTEPSNALGLLDMHFKPISWGGVMEIKVTAQGNTMGIADLDIGLEDYYQSEGDQTPASFVMQIPGFGTDTIAGGIRYIRYIDNIDLSHFNLYGIENDNSFNITDKITATIYSGVSYTGSGGKSILEGTFNNGGTRTDLGASTSGNVYIKFTMLKHLGQTPIFNWVTITYGV